MGRLPDAPARRRRPSSKARTIIKECLMTSSAVTSPGERFARALAAKDSAALRQVLADRIDFQALTPGRSWQAPDGIQVADDIVLGHWFGADAEITELCSVASGQVADRDHVTYRLRVRRSGVDYLVEQQAYYDSEPASGQITWMRILCSGYRPADRSRR
jgi:hypothetical protein